MRCTVILTSLLAFSESACPKGKHVASTSACLACGQGKFQNQEAFTGTECTACPAGKFQDGTQQEDCKQCSAGKFQEQEAKSACKICTQGRFSSSAEAQSCLDCVSTGNNKYQDAGDQISCKTCSSCSTNNARSGFGQYCEPQCELEEPSKTFIAILQGSGYAGQLSQNQLAYAQDVLEQQLKLTNKNNAQIYLQSLKITAGRRLISAQAHSYEITVFEPFSLTGTMTDTENAIMAELVKTANKMSVTSFRAQNTPVVSNSTAEESGSSISTGAAVGIGLGATLVAAFPILAKGAEPAIKGGSALGEYVAKRRQKNGLLI